MKPFLLALLVAPLSAGNPDNFTYLALGDSIAFGFDPTLLPPISKSTQLPTPDKFTGYPEKVAEFNHLLQSGKEVNASCPGETSASFLIAGAPDNGCLAFKTEIGLHTTYKGTQASFAFSQLATNKHINLVTLSIGGNDLLLLQQRCNIVPQNFAACVEADLASSTGTLALYAGNLAAILGTIRANYQGTLILMTSYTPNVDPLFLQAIEGLNLVMVEVGTHFGVKFADGFTAFQIASAPFGGDPCKAGLLIRFSPPLTSPLVCDVHPSPIGRDILAITVLLTNALK
jgi:lysophospholipase L1-like esterase